MSPAQKISFLILINMFNGMTLSDAFDSVLGVGAYQKFTNSLYDEFTQTKRS
jgi:hypothetical protein